VSGCNFLTKLNFAVNHITEIALEYNPLLEKMNASKNLLTKLNVSKNPALKVLIVNDMPSLESICVELLSSQASEMNILSTDNTRYQFIEDCI
jgi:hypothetical protein